MEPRNYLANASATPPAAPGTPSNGYPQSAVPGVNEATVPGPFWFYKIGEEIRNAIIAAGLTPDDDVLTQLSAAITRAASETVKGVIEIVTAAEAQALTDDVRALTPAKLAAALQGSNQLQAVAGYQKLPGGVIVQWGFSQATTGGSGVTFPLAFPTAIWNVTSGINSTSESSIKATTLSLTGFTFTSASATSSHSWIAIGN
jgi:hypothetical protein